MKRLKVNPEEIMAHMQCQDRDIIDFYLDTGNGDVIIIPEEVFRAVDNGAPIENFPDEDKEIARISKEILFDDSKRYVNIPVIPSDEGYNFMVEFIEGIKDGKVKSRFAKAIIGKGAFSRFKDLLYNYPEIQQEWYRFKDEKLNGNVVEWLKSIGIEPEL